MERLVKSIEMEGLIWSTFTLAPVAYGVKKLVAGELFCFDLKTKN